MKTVFLLASALAYGVSLNAQMTAVLNRLPGRSPEVEIGNRSSVSLTAIAVRLAPAAQSAGDGAPLMVYVDAAVDTEWRVSREPGRTMPLLPNQKYSVPLPVRFRPGLPREDLFALPLVTAGIFADGTTTGDTDLVGRLILRRCNMLQAVDLARAVLSDAGRGNMPRRQLIEQFQKMADSLDHWYLPPEQQVGRRLYQSIVEELMNLPALKLGEPFPPTAYVEHEMTLLNRQRTTLLESEPGLSLARADSIRR